jgi:di- and tripeptidase
MHDLVGLLSQFKDPASGEVTVPKFEKDVQDITKEEMEAYENIEFDVKEYAARLGVQEDSLKGQTPKEILMKRWRFPTLSCTGVRVRADNDSVIPSKVEARVSVRTVPNQDSQAMANDLVEFAKSIFAKMNTPNKLEVEIEASTTWWLGDRTNQFYRAASSAIEEHWGCKPMFVREGGTTMLTPILEDVFKCPSLHFPMVCTRLPHHHSCSFLSRLLTKSLQQLAVMEKEEGGVGSFYV